MFSIRRTTLCREGWYYAIVLILVFSAALVRDVNLLMLLSGLMAGPLLLSGFLTLFTLHGLEVRRKVPRGVCAGDLLVASVTLTNTRHRLGSWAVVVEEPIQREHNGNGKNHHPKRLLPGIFFPYLPAGRSRKGTYRGRLALRGRYRLGPLRLSTRFPFGLFCHTASVGPSESLVVFPRLGRLTRGWVARHRESFAGAKRREQRAGSDGDFYGIRPWRGGDTRRWIHWRTSARVGKLMVRQFEQPRNRDVALLLDLWQPEHPRPEHDKNVELAVSFTATVIADLCRKGDSNVHLGIADPRPKLSGGAASAPLLHELMEQLALIEPQSGDCLAELLRQAFLHTQPGDELVVVSTRPLDWNDAARLGPSGADAAARTRSRRIRVIDTSSRELGRYFQTES